MEWVLEQVSAGCRRIALLAPTAADCRAVMVEGHSGILAIAPPWNRPEFNPSLRRLSWPNGAIATLFSADEPERLRGYNSDWAAIDEICAFRRPEAFDMLQFGLRIGERPRCAIATTPKPTWLLKQILAREGHDCVVSRSTSYDNRANLAPTFFSKIIQRYEHTRLGRQELLAEVLDDVPGALWSRDRIEQLRRDACPPLRRVVIAVDPSGGAGDEHDEVGLVVCGLDEAGHGWLLVDASSNMGPNEWAQAAARLYHEHRADRVLAEVNYGGAMVESVLRAVDPNIPFKALTASRGKAQRAEPISSLYEQGRVHHLGAFPELEDELCSFTTTGYVGPSPNRADALVWALTELMAQPMPSYAAYELARYAAEGRPILPPGANPLLQVYQETQARIAAGQNPFAPAPAANVPDDTLINGETAWRLRYAAQHGGWVNGPNVRSIPQSGSVEFDQQRKMIVNA
jgi:phage terminase large subunit-like protein